MEAIRAAGLTKRFGDVTAVDGLDLSVAAGELIALVGSDGAGKTTTLRMLTGIMDPTAGEVCVLGKEMSRQGKAVRGDIGYMSQRFGLYEDLTVEENILFFADIYGLPRREGRERAEELLGFAKLTSFKKRFAGKLSGGMKQKLGLACALIHKPRILFLDEPTNGVDPVSRRDFWRILHQLVAEGVTVCVATSYLDEAERCNRVALMDRGKVLGCDTPAALKGMMKGVVLELATARPRVAVRALAALFPAGSMALFGEKVHLYALDPDEVQRTAAEKLKESGVDLLGVRRVEPTLEDLFVSLLRERH